MPVPKKEGTSSGGGAIRADGRAQNGNRSNFRTDTAISNSRFGNERTLQPWVPDAADGVDGSLEATASGGSWDQFAANEKLFGLQTDYDESMYTTTINKSHPQFRERVAAADKKAKEIERSVPTTAHVAEERIMDYVGGAGAGEENEEEKYSGVRRQDFPALSGGGRENRYTPPAKRAPTSQSTVKGAPVDPAIISSQLRAPVKRHPVSTEQIRSQAPDGAKNGVTVKVEPAKTSTPKLAEEGPAESKASPVINISADSKTPESKPSEKAATPGPSSTSSSRNASSQPKETTPSATSTVERDVLKEFKSFATQQRINAEKARTNKARADKEVKLTELKKFASSFKLSTPVPTDLVSIIAKDPAKQKEIQAKAMRNAEEMAKTKADSGSKDKGQSTKDSGTAKTPDAGTSANTSDGRSSRSAVVPQASGPVGNGTRHTGPRQQFPQQPYHVQQPYRNNRGPQHGPPQQQTGNLAQRLRNVEQQRYSQPPAPPQHGLGHEMRAPPTGPSGNVDSGFNRRLSGAPGQMGAKLNPNSHEFRPSPFAAAFNPNSHASAGSSPRTSVNHVAESPISAAPQTSVIRRKTKKVDVKKCLILSHIKSVTPPAGRNWDDNGGLRPSFDTLPTWRQLKDDEKPESTMHLTYAEHFDRQPFNGPSAATPNPTHVVPQMPHQHQLPFHLQHGAHGLGSRQSPHMAPMQMHAPQHGPVPIPPYGTDDHRMMPSNSAQSFASPRMGQLPVAYPGQVPYQQPVFMAPSNPQMGQYRSFSNNPHYVPPQQSQMAGPMMMQPQFIHHQGMVAAPQMMYHGGHPHYMPPAGPPQPGPGGNGYPSPGRPTAPVMMHQGSQQGQPVYGMSPGVQYNQPAYGPGQPSGPSQ
ncbi:PAB1 binding protein (Pbp1) [Metarhizium album ARSEF 1941]|uniref:PAB1 binding protein (Pbp1) n=1 Tax=Metarhizium album (strain ARSEF 1941) TaxID=1081103 RepID=A0A0B2WQE1_METAS|nr:PAB1 binding protein (Pbp1) [Metarhizium album ARSEF 1941]KHN95854.1 PAB1 binding protein (Pbp1) [Metarhizium album ARSEF 1941]